MIYFIIGIICASGIFITFKFWDKYNVSPYHATIINYMVSALVAYILCSPKPTLTGIIGAPWLYYAVALGTISLIDFNLNSFTTKKLGIGVTSMSSKLSLLLPVTLSIFLFEENVDIMKLSGILLALIALILISIQKRTVSSTANWKKIFYFLPCFVFLGSGMNDFLMLMLGRVNSGPQMESQTNVVFVVFTMAFTIGLLLSLVLACFGKFNIKEYIDKRNLLGGIAMGMVSIACFSLYLKGIASLTSQGWDGSTLASIYAVGVLLMSVLVGILVFKEKFRPVNYLGMMVALFAIVILSLN